MRKVYTNLTLYHFEACPFCQRVRQFIRDHGMTITEKDIRLDSEAQDELIEIGGKSQVPCLVVDGMALYESGDIMDWLSENWVSE